MHAPSPRAILFDLDGTLVDTAPDMVGALNQLCTEHSQQQPDATLARSTVSNGGPALVRLAFGTAISDQRFGALFPRFLEIYEQRVADESLLFAGMQEVLEYAEKNQQAWGVVTNKPERLSERLLEELDLLQRSHCLVGGDTLAVKKPDPEPLLSAARSIQVGPHECLYVGDNVRDIEAGNRAGMTTIAAGWGYILPDDDIDTWQADFVISVPLELLAFMAPAETTT